MQSQVVAIGLCTYGRPALLRQCLDSLAAQRVPPSTELALVVVDNEPAPNNRSGVMAFAATCPLAVHYVHQPKRGIAAARNAILDKARELDAAWIAMLDDDETAAPDWIAGLMAPEHKDTPILQGHRIFVYPDPKPFWARRKERQPPAEGATAKLVSTYNVRFSAELLRAGLRFDETLGLCGGEDRRFFDAAARMGFKARSTNKAVTYEAVHLERLTYRYELARRYAEVAGITALQIQSFGPGTTLANLPRLVAYIPLGLIEIALSPLAALFGVERFKRFALRGGHRLAQVAGHVSALMGHLPQHYRQIAGS
jgi:succinoglycan biosynthesis protein ExoM